MDFKVAILKAYFCSFFVFLCLETRYFSSPFSGVFSPFSGDFSPFSGDFSPFLGDVSPFSAVAIGAVGVASFLVSAVGEGIGETYKTKKYTGIVCNLSVAKNMAGNGCKMAKHKSFFPNRLH